MEANKERTKIIACDSTKDKTKCISVEYRYDSTGICLGLYLAIYHGFGKEETHEMPSECTAMDIFNSMINR